MASIQFRARRGTVFLVFARSRSEKVELSTPYRVNDRDWNAQRQMVRLGTSLASEINNGIRKIEEEVTRAYNTDPLAPWAVLRNRITEAVKGKKEDVTGLWDIWQKYLDVQAVTLHSRTIQKFRSTMDYVYSLPGRPQDFLDMDIRFFDRLIASLIDKGYLNDTIEKHVRCCMQMLRWSQERGYHQNMIFTRSDIGPKKAVKNEIVALTEDELSALMSLDLPTELSKVRYLFCFSCFTGARWSDCSNFDKSQIVGDTWKFSPYKNRKMQRIISIPNHGFCKGAFECLERLGYRIPDMTEQYVNEKIKHICMLAGIHEAEKITRMSGSRTVVKTGPKWKFITFHSGRRTFISILLSRGVPATIVMELTGISNLKTLQKYIKTDYSAVLRELDKAEERGIMGRVVNMR